MTSAARGPSSGGHYTDDSGVGSYTSSVVGSLRSSSSHGPYGRLNSNAADNDGIGSFSSSAAADPMMLTLPIVVVRLLIPELDVETSLHLNQSDSIWNLKQCILNTIATDLEDDGINHGLYCPPVNGRAGKYLDEERCLGEYGLRDDTILELITKRRLYKTTSFDWKKIQEFNTRTRCRRLLHYLRSGSINRLTRLLTKGLDPNFHNPDSGETPLTMAANLRHSRDAIMALVEGGAILDYRNRLGLTPLHRAAQNGNREAVQALLELGASPDSKDPGGLTPLYYAVCNDTDPGCSELLLRDYATLGTRDEAGWTEVHQTCRYGGVQHLEHLVFYGCDVNSRNYSGNTPLHICALNNQEECCRVLLFRGADKTIRNLISQDAESLAVFCGFHRLAEVIRKFSPNDVVLHQEAPLYNSTRRRRMTQSQRSSSADAASLFLLQGHLSCSTSQVPRPSSEPCIGSLASRRSPSEESSRSSVFSRASTSRTSSRERSRSSSRPSGRPAFDVPDIRSAYRKNANLVMSCAAAGQRSRARSRSRSGNVLERFKNAKREDQRSSSVPPPRSPPGKRNLPPVTRPGIASAAVSPGAVCLREALPPGFEPGSCQDNGSKGVGVMDFCHQGQKVNDSRDQEKTIRMGSLGYPVNDHWIQNRSSCLIGAAQNSDHRNGRLGLSHHGALGLSHHGALGLSHHGALGLSHHGALGLSHHGALPPLQDQRNPLFHLAVDRRTQPPPPPPLRRTFPPIAGFDGIPGDEREESVGGSDPPKTLSPWIVLEGLPVSSPDDRRTGNAFRNNVEPAHRPSVGHVTDFSRDANHSAPPPSKLLPGRTSSPLYPLPPPPLPPPRPLPPSPLPPYPGSAQSLFQDNQPLPPPPSNLPLNHLDTSSTFTAQCSVFPLLPPQTSKPSSSHLQFPVVTSPAGDRLAGGGRVLGVTGTAEVQTALFAAVQKRRLVLDQMMM